MKDLLNTKLSSQLLWLVGIAFVMLFTTLGIIIPNLLVPVAESNLYNYLSEPLKYVDDEVDTNLLSLDISYIYLVDEKLVFSDNLDSVISINDPNKILDYITSSYGKFIYKHNTYYYYTLKSDNLTKIAISNDSYINNTKADILSVIFPIVLLTFLIIVLILILWSSIIVWKINRLKNKIDHIDDSSYNHNIDFMGDDEIKSLAYAIEDMRLSLKSTEEYRNQMYQNISHDFKTPLTVIKSYIEAVEDEVEDSATALQIIKDETNKLEQKVHSLLYLNKLDYLKDKEIELVEVDMINIVNTEVEKFKHNNLKFKVDYDKKSKYFGTVEHWETILDNLLSNALRYAKSEIKITLKNNKLIVYNDGDNIEPSLLEGIFTPFRKGIKGQFGLGLSIVKKTLNIMKYDITIHNEKRGVSFIIYKDSRN